MVTTITISDKLWMELSKMKKPKMKTFEEVLWDLVKNVREVRK